MLRPEDKLAKIPRRTARCSARDVHEIFPHLFPRHITALNADNAPNTTTKYGIDAKNSRFAHRASLCVENPAVASQRKARPAVRAMGA